MKVQINLSNSDEIQRRLKRDGEMGKKVALRVFARACQRVVPKAQALAPQGEEDGGDLRSSIRESKPTITKSGRVSAGVVAGGAPLAKLASEKGRRLPGLYAVVQHEDLTLKHAQGGAKFLEKPFLQEAVRVPDELVREMDQEAELAR